MNKNLLMQKLIRLEYDNKNLYSQLLELDNLMRLVGFEKGLETVKGAAEEIQKDESKHTEE